MVRGAPRCPQPLTRSKIPGPGVLSRQVPPPVSATLLAHATCRDASVPGSPWPGQRLWLACIRQHLCSSPDPVSRDGGSSIVNSSPNAVDTVFSHLTFPLLASAQCTSPSRVPFCPSYFSRAELPRHNHVGRSRDDQGAIPRRCHSQRVNISPLAKRL